MANYRGIVEDYIGRKLKYGENIHHLNQNPRDNRPENLYIFKSIGDHLKFHHLVDRGYLSLDVLQSNLPYHAEIERKEKLKTKEPKIHPYLENFKYSKEHLAECTREIRDKMVDKYPWTPTEEQANEFLKISEEI